MLRNILFILFFFHALGTISLNAQHVLILEKQGKTKRLRYQVGSELTLKLFGSDTLISRQIAKLMDTTIYMEGKLIGLSSIEKIYIGKNRHNVQTLAGLGSIGAGLYFGISLLNRFTNNDSPTIEKSMIIVPASFLAFYGLMRISEKKWFVVNSKNKVKVLNLSPV